MSKLFDSPFKKFDAATNTVEYEGKRMSWQAAMQLDYLKEKERKMGIHHGASGQDEYVYGGDWENGWQDFGDGSYAMGGSYAYTPPEPKKVVAPLSREALAVVKVGSMDVEVRKDFQFWRKTQGLVTAEIPVDAKELRRLMHGGDYEDVKLDEDLLEWDKSMLPPVEALKKWKDALQGVCEGEAIVYFYRHMTDMSKWLGIVPKQEATGGSVDVDKLAATHGLAIERGFMPVAGNGHLHPGAMIECSQGDINDWSKTPGLYVVMPRTLNSVGVYASVRGYVWHVIKALELGDAIANDDAAALIGEDGRTDKFEELIERPRTIVTYGQATSQVGFHGRNEKFDFAHGRSDAEMEKCGWRKSGEGQWTWVGKPKKERAGGEKSTLWNTSYASAKYDKKKGAVVRDSIVEVVEGLKRCIPSKKEAGLMLAAIKNTAGVKTEEGERTVELGWEAAEHVCDRVLFEGPVMADLALLQIATKHAEGPKTLNFRVVPKWLAVALEKAGEPGRFTTYALTSNSAKVSDDDTTVE